jgi:hypothetical protein
MALVMVAVGVCGLACWLAAVLLLPRRAALLRRRTVLLPGPSSNPEPDSRNPSRDEDRVRPAVTASGERIWIEPDELVWHEIVAWPQPRPAARDRKDARRPA